MPNHNTDIKSEIEEGLARANMMLHRQRNRQIYYAFLGLCILAGLFFIGFLINRPTGSSLPLLNSGLYFSSDRSGKYEIYYLKPDSKIKQITHTASGQSWGPALSPTSTLYFTSDRDGKSEIYALASGAAVRVTTSPGKSHSWRPIPGFFGLYFVSNRSGKNEIYYIGLFGPVVQVTNTPGFGESLFSIGE